MHTVYLVLANLVAIVHLTCMVLFVYLITLSVRGKLSAGIFRLFLRSWIVGKIASFFILGACIFTLTEQQLRLLANGHTYTVGYIEHYSHLLGVYISPATIEGLVVTPLVVGILSEVWWYNKKRSVKTV